MMAGGRGARRGREQSNRCTWAHDATQVPAEQWRREAGARPPPSVGEGEWWSGYHTATGPVLLDLEPLPFYNLAECPEAMHEVCAHQEHARKRSEWLTQSPTA